MTDEKPAEPSDNGNIEGSALGGSVKIPARRSDVGPYLKWIIIAIAYTIAAAGTGFTIRMVLGGL